MLTAEQMIAKHGIRGASVVAIAKAAGLSNNSAVQYHFGSKERLVRALLDIRMEAVDRRRLHLLNQLTEMPGHEISIADMVRVYLQPFSEMADAEGMHTFARFFFQFLTQAQPWRGVPELHVTGVGRAAIQAHLAEITPHISPDARRIRLRWLVRLYLSAIVDFENARIYGGTEDDAPGRLLSAAFTPEAALHDLAAIGAALFENPVAAEPVVFKAPAAP